MIEYKGAAVTKVKYTSLTKGSMGQFVWSGKECDPRLEEVSYTI